MTTPEDDRRNAEFGRRAAEAVADAWPKDHPQTDAEAAASPHTELAAELRKGRGIRIGVQAIFLALIVAMAGLAAYYRWDQEHACDVAREVRVHSESLDRDVYRRMGRRFGVPDGEVEAFLLDVAAAYEAMPEPAAC